MYMNTEVGPMYETMMTPSHCEYRFVPSPAEQCPKSALLPFAHGGPGTIRTTSKIWRSPLKLRSSSTASPGAVLWKCQLVPFGARLGHVWEIEGNRLMISSGGWNLDINGEWNNTQKSLLQSGEVEQMANSLFLCGSPNFSHDQILFQHPYRKSRSLNHLDSLRSSLNSAGSEVICKLIPSGKPGGFLGFNYPFLYSFNRHFTSILWNWSRYKPHTIELDTVLKPFIPELIPSIGEALKRCFPVGLFLCHSDSVECCKML